MERVKEGRKKGKLKWKKQILNIKIKIERRKNKKKRKIEKK